MCAELEKLYPGRSRLVHAYKELACTLRQQAVIDRADLLRSATDISEEALKVFEELDLSVMSMVRSVLVVCRKMICRIRRRSGDCRKRDGRLLQAVREIYRSVRRRSLGCGRETDSINKEVLRCLKQEMLFVWRIFCDDRKLFE